MAGVVAIFPLLIMVLALIVFSILSSHAYLPYREVHDLLHLYRQEVPAVCLLALLRAGSR